MKTRIDSLQPIEHAQIFQIIKRYTQSYSSADSIILVSTENLSSECIEEIEKYISFLTDQKKSLEEYMITRREYERRMTQ